MHGSRRRSRPAFFGHAFRVCQAGNQAGEVSGMEEHRRGLKAFARVYGVHPDGFGAITVPRRSSREIQACICSTRAGRRFRRARIRRSRGRGGSPGNVSHPDRGGPPELRFQIGKGRRSPGRGGGCQDQGLRLFIGIGAISRRPRIGVPPG